MSRALDWSIGNKLERYATEALLVACMQAGHGQMSCLPGRQVLLNLMRAHRWQRAGEPDLWKRAMALLRDKMRVVISYASSRTEFVDGWTAKELLASHIADGSGIAVADEHPQPTLQCLATKTVTIRQRRRKQARPTKSRSLE
jgi:hypothetical protein